MRSIGGQYTGTSNYDKKSKITCILVSNQDALWDMLKWAIFSFRTVIAFFATIVYAATTYHLTFHYFIKRRLLKKPEPAVKPANGVLPETHAYVNMAAEGAGGGEKSTSFNDYGAVKPVTIGEGDTIIEEDVVADDDKSKERLGKEMNKLL